MSFFKLDDTANISNDNIKYIYTGTSVNKRDITEHSNDEKFNSIKKTDLPETEGKRIPFKDTFYKINFVNREPNFTFAGITPSSYVANTMYLYGLLHRNIAGVTSKTNNSIIGEIVIQHANANKQAQKVFTCFLVEEMSDKTTDNSIDTLMKMITGEGTDPDMTVELNTIIPKQTTCVYYVDDENHVFLFTTPLQVNKAAADVFRNKLSVDTKLFKVYPPTNYNVINMNKEKKAQEGFTLQEGATGEIYIDCQPTGESAETIQAYAVPINSAYGDSKNQIDFFKMMINFGVFLIISILTYFTIPPFYKHVVVDKINRQYEKSRDIETRRQFIYIADLWLIAIFIISIVDAFMGGIAKTGHYSLIQYGIGLCVVLIVSFALIQMNKLHSAFMTTGDIDSSYPSDPEYMPSTGGLRNIGQFFLDLYLKPLAQDNGRTFAKIFVIWALVVTIPGLFLTSYASEQVSSTWFKRLIPASIFALTPAIYLSATP
jgi:hypothetical protein